MLSMKYKGRVSRGTRSRSTIFMVIIRTGSGGWEDSRVSGNNKFVDSISGKTHYRSVGGYFYFCSFFSFQILVSITIGPHGWVLIWDEGGAKEGLCLQGEQSQFKVHTCNIFLEMQGLTRNLHLMCFAVGVTFSVVSFLPALAFLTYGANTSDPSGETSH